MRNLNTRLVLGSLRWAILASAVLTPAMASADDLVMVPAADSTFLRPPAKTPVKFADVTTQLGITYRRAPSTIKGAYDAVKIKPFYSNLENNQMPLKYRGAPGVALLDYDNDGDVDMFVTNGPGRGHSLYKNLQAQTGQLAFVDVAAAAGVSAVEMDGTGVCHGDIDNDGDADLLVLGRMENNRLFRNNGDGTFTDITGSAKIGGGPLGHSSCSMGDINNDGLIDIFVANTFDWVRQDAVFTNPFGYNHPNQLYLNQGGNVFKDVSATSGILTLHNVPPGDSTISWSSMMVDYDQDGDLDIIHADDQAAYPPAAFAGIDRGFLQIFRNDGTGRFTNVTQQAGTNQASQWMGISIGDLNGDGRFDLFATTVGDYLVHQYGMPTPPGYSTSRWFLGLGAETGKFVNPGVGDLVASPFGWSSGMVDYDNDGDTDIAFYGNLDVGPFITCDNPGIILSNDGNAKMTWDRDATLSSADKVARGDVNSMALGDLNNDGFVDIVHVSGHYVPANMPLVPAVQKWGSPFDAVALVAPNFFPIGPFEYEWAGRDTDEGYMGVQLSSASNGNGWVKVGVKGTKDLTTGGRVNRDGIGAIVKFTPKKGKTAMAPVLAGSGHSGQHSMVQSFGLGAKESKGMVEVFWPGGVKNRLYDVESEETVTIPEIPCSFTASYQGGNSGYKTCVNGALNQLFFREVITAKFMDRLRTSAFKAWDETH